MDLIDIGEHPELEPTIVFPNTPLYISDDEDFSTAQGFTDLDKVGVKKFIVDAFPLLYQPLGTLGIENPKMTVQKQLTETILESDESGVCLLIDNQNIKIPYSAIERAHLVHEFDAGKGQKKKV